MDVGTKRVPVRTHAEQSLLGGPHGPLLRPLDVVVATALAEATHRGSWEHGERHWQQVAEVGYQLACAVPACDALVVFLFGLLHDVKRQDDGDDPDHGERAAALARRCNGYLYARSSAQMVRLEAACRLHNLGYVSADATIGTCWDADRLLLGRGGITPDPRGLSTSAARHPARKAWAQQVLLRAPRSWEALWSDYQRLAAPTGWRRRPAPSRPDRVPSLPASLFRQVSLTYGCDHRPARQTA